MKRMFCLMLLLALLNACVLAEENRYDALNFYGERDMWPVRQDGGWGFVDADGVLILPCEWDDVGMVVGGRAPVCKDGKWGAIDRAGNIIVPCEWTMLFVYEDGGFVINDNGRSGALASDGSMLVPCGKFDSVGTVIDGARRIRKGEKWGLCTEDGMVISDCQWNDTGYFSEDLAWVKDEKRLHGYVNWQGETVISCQYWHAEDFHDGSAVVQLSTGYYNLIDTSGRLLCTPAWTDMETFTDNALIMVRRGDKYGYINRRGEVVIPPVYDNAQAFGDGLALVKLGEDSFWIDETGKKALDRPEGYVSHPFRDGLVALKNAQELNGMMDKQGNFVIPCEWDNWLHYAFGMGEIDIVTKDGQIGFVNRQGELIAGGLRAREKVSYGLDGDRLFLLEDGVLSIYAADGTKVY